MKRELCPRIMILVLVLSDCFSLALSGLLAILLRGGILRVSAMDSYLSLAPYLLLFVLIFWSFGLYSGVSPTSPEELRKSTLACIVISWCAGASVVVLHEKHQMFTVTTFLCMAISAVAVPFVREIVRLKFSGSSWWGYPAVLFGRNEVTDRLVRTLKRQTDIGLKPLAILSLESAEGEVAAEIPVIREFEVAEWQHALKGKGYAVISGGGERQKEYLDIVARNRRLFPHIVIVPENWEFSCLWINPRNLGGVLGLEVGEHLFRPGRRLLKRTVDLLLTGVASVLLLPLFVAIAAAVKIESRGPILYRQRRIGLGGKEFSAWKFRSMVVDADAKLAEYLDGNPQLKCEWLANHKLKTDPRITRIGALLRRTSLDELPQLWNVMCGQMSLVGPRPIVRDEIARYGRHFGLYTSVRSGLTGLWQVSGRSQTSYQQRVDFDAFYVRNWSIWLDLCILFRTIGALWLRTGAYQRGVRGHSGENADDQ